MYEPEISAFRHPDIRVLIDAQLVLRAVGIDSRVDQTEHGFALYVAEHDFGAAREHLALYAAENDRPPPRPVRRDPPLPWLGAVIYCLAPLWFVFIAAERHLGGADWYRAGRVDGAAIFAGDAWRLTSALTLHADLGHLLVNLGSAAVVVAVAARLLGSGVTALSLLAAGTLGNAINLAFQGTGHLSVGASTAIFAGVGLVGVVETLRHGLSQRDWATRIGPLVLAVIVLTFFGTGSERTDVGAHWWGFVSGALVGIGVGRIGYAALSRALLQRATGLAALAVLVITWWCAFA